MNFKRYGGALAIAAVCLAGWLERPAIGQTIQLPSFQRFSYTGSVLVPDRGSASLGGVSRSFSSRSSRRGSGVARSSGLSHSGASVHVTIIDHDAIDRQLRGLPADGGTVATHNAAAAAAGKPIPARRASTRRNSARRTSVLGTTAHRPSDHQPSDRQPNDRSAIDPDAEGKTLVRYARRQYLAGNHASAFDAYQLAFTALSPSLKRLAEAEFDRVFPSGKRPVPSDKRPTGHQRPRVASQPDDD
jgi:hypothetical protein